MPVVKVERDIRAPIETVYALAKGVEEFPSFMPDVESVEILSRDGPCTVSRWVGVVKQLNRKLRWTEEDHWDDDAHSCVFEQIEGDYSIYRGTWHFCSNEQVTHAVLEIEFEISVPLIGPLIKGVIARLMKDNCEGMLSALTRKAESQG